MGPTRALAERLGCRLLYPPQPALPRKYLAHPAPGYALYYAAADLELLNMKWRLARTGDAVSPEPDGARHAARGPARPKQTLPSVHANRNNSPLLAAQRLPNDA